MPKKPTIVVHFSILSGVTLVWLMLSILTASAEAMHNVTPAEIPLISIADFNTAETFATIGVLDLALLKIDAGSETVSGSVYRVDTTSTASSPDGLSWTTAYTNIQDALLEVNPGDEIWVAEGVYYPDEGSGQSNNVVASTFQLQSDVAIYGGFAGTETAQEQRASETFITILSGDIDKNDTNTDGNNISETWGHIQGNNAYHIVTGSGVDQSAILDGFVITAGSAMGFESVSSCANSCGGAIFNSGGSPTLKNLRIIGNTSRYYGGAVTNLGSSPTLISVTLQSNETSYEGGGMYNYNASDIKLTDVKIINNEAYEKGGGVYNYNSSLTLENTTFQGNDCHYDGGAIYSMGGNLSLTDVTFSENQATAGYGGGMYTESGNPILLRVTFTENYALVAGGGMYNKNGQPELTQVDFFANSVYGSNGATYMGGGGMANENGDATMVNVSFFGNRSNNVAGGAIYNQSSSNVSITNGVFSGNYAYEYGGGIICYGGSLNLVNTTFSKNKGDWGAGGAIHSECNLTISGGIFWGNSNYYGLDQIDSDATSVISYTLIQGSGGSGPGWDSNLGTDLGGNLDEDPLFLDADGNDNVTGTADDNLRLQSTSPAIDAGNNEAVSVEITTDLDGVYRFVDWSGSPDVGNGVAPIIDMGAYEYTGFTCAPDHTDSANPAQVASYIHTLSNEGAISDTFNLSASSSQGWSVEIDPAVTLTLAGGISMPITVNISIPAGVPHNTVDTTTVTAVSGNDPSLSVKVSDTTTVIWHNIYLPIVKR